MVAIFHVIFHIIFWSILIILMQNMWKWAENGPKMATVNNPNSQYHTHTCRPCDPNTAVFTIPMLFPMWKWCSPMNNLTIAWPYMYSWKCGVYVKFWQFFLQPHHFCLNSFLLSIMCQMLAKQKPHIQTHWSLMSTSYHPETDGSSEWTNKTVNQTIWYHVDNNQKGWLAKLPQVWFAIMNTMNASRFLWHPTEYQAIPPHHISDHTSPWQCHH